jgi:hypothetical protein
MIEAESVVMNIPPSYEVGTRDPNSVRALVEILNVPEGMDPISMGYPSLYTKAENVRPNGMPGPLLPKKDVLASPARQGGVCTVEEVSDYKDKINGASRWALEKDYCRSGSPDDIIPNTVLGTECGDVTRGDLCSVLHQEPELGPQLLNPVQPEAVAQPTVPAQPEKISQPVQPTSPEYSFQQPPELNDDLIVDEKKENIDNAVREVHNFVKNVVDQARNIAIGTGVLTALGIIGYGAIKYVDWRGSRAYWAKIVRDGGVDPVDVVMTAVGRGVEITTLPVRNPINNLRNRRKYSHGNALKEHKTLAEQAEVENDRHQFDIDMKYPKRATMLAPNGRGGLDEVPAPGVVEYPDGSLGPDLNQHFPALQWAPGAFSDEAIRYYQKKGFEQQRVWEERRSSNKDSE